MSNVYRVMEFHRALWYTLPQSVAVF